MNDPIILLIEYLLTIDYSLWLDRLKLFAETLSVILLVPFIWIVIKLRALIFEDINLAVDQLDPPPQGTSAFDARWAEVKRHMDAPSSAGWKFAIIEADKLVDDVLRAAGFVGDSMGERMMSIQPGQVPSLDKLWRAHKVRNRLAHEINADVSYGEALEAIKDFEIILRDFGAIS